MKGTPVEPARPTIAVAIAIIVDGPRVLIARRYSDVPPGGLWEFPGGKIEGSESPAAAAVREVREELGIEVNVIEPWPAIAHAYPHAAIMLWPMICRRAAGEPQAIGCAQWKWVSADELSAYEFPEANAKLLTDIARLLRLQSRG